MAFKINDTIRFTQSKPWTAKDGSKHIQRDTLLARVTSATERNVEYVVIQRLLSLDTAPFDEGGSTGGGFATRFADRMGIEII